MSVALRTAAPIRRLESEQLKFRIGRLRKEPFGQSSEGGRLFAERLELAIADVEDEPGAAETEADIAAPEAAATARQSRPVRSRRPDDLPVERILCPAPAPGGPAKRIGEAPPWHRKASRPTTTLVQAT